MPGPGQRLRSSGSAGVGRARALLRGPAGGAPAAPATNPEILVLEAVAANHCLQSHSGMSVLLASSDPYIPLLRPRGGVLRSGSGPSKI